MNPNYPSYQAVEKAGLEQLVRWWLLLPQPACREETAVIERVAFRASEFQGYRETMNRIRTELSYQRVTGAPLSASQPLVCTPPVVETPNSAHSRVLFIGGPLDGQLIDLPRNSSIWVAFEKTRPIQYDSLEINRNEVSLTFQEYRYRRLFFRNGLGPDGGVFVPEQSTEGDLISRLVKFYKPPKRNQVDPRKRELQKMKRRIRDRQRREQQHQQQYQKFNQQSL